MSNSTHALTHTCSCPVSKDPSSLSTLPSIASSQATMEMSIAHIGNRSEGEDIIDVDKIEEILKNIEQRGKH
jgi:hypothetical protein